MGTWAFDLASLAELSLASEDRLEARPGADGLELLGLSYLCTARGVDVDRSLQRIERGLTVAEFHVRDSQVVKGLITVGMVQQQS